MLTDSIKETLEKHNIRLLYILTERFVDAIRREYRDKDPEVILDIGSRDLDQSIELRSAFPNARIIAFEPNPEQYKLCYERSKLFDIDFVGCAVSDEEGESDFWIVDLNEGGSSLLKPINVPWSTNISKKVKVPCRRIDNVLKEMGIDHVDCVWMDVQGYELKVLKSFGDYLKDVKVIHGEASPNPCYEGHVQLSELEDYLLENDFELDFLPSHAHPYGEGDLLCIKNERYNTLTQLCDVVYENAKESLKIRPVTIGLFGSYDDSDYMKRYFANSTTYCFNGIDLSNEETIDQALENSGVYYDVIIDSATTEYWDQIKLIRTAARHLAPGGIIIIQNLIHSEIERYSFHIWEYMHDAYFFIEKFESDHFVLIRNNLKYGKYSTKQKNSFVIKETYED
jgi:FkbM family methyltransferase